MTLIRMPKPNRINFKDLISEIKKGIILIPRFQRDFVWKLEDTANLLDSVLKGYPIGTFILWITRERMASVKELGGKLFPEPHKNDNVQYVLDGQQRIASLFVAHEGLKHKREKVELDYGKIYVNLDDVTDDEDSIITTIMRENYISFYDLLNKNLLDFEDQFDRKFREKIQEYKNIFNKYEFSTIELRDFSLESAVEIFTRINTTGTVLTLFEIMVAKTYDEDKNFDMQNEYDMFKKKKLEKAHFETLRPRTILNILGLAIQGECTREVILGLDKDEIIDRWDEVLKSIQCSIDFIKTHLNIPVSEILAYDSLIAPISYFYYKNNFNDPNINQTKYLKQYFWSASLSYRYTSATNSKLKKDIENIDSITNGKIPQFDFKINIDKEDIKNMNFSTGNSFCKAILCLYAQQDPLSFKYGSKIILDNSWLRRANSKNYHHFFPRQYLKDKGISNRNSIVNITFVNERLNISMKDNAPSKYMNKFHISNPKFDETLKSHLIDDPNSFGVWNDDYNKFLEKRTAKIISELNQRIL